MSVQHFCDACGEKLTHANRPSGGRIVRGLGSMTIEIIVARDGTWNAGDFCTKCILDTVANGEESQKTWGA